jgi:hypothetical protein
LKNIRPKKCKEMGASRTLLDGRCICFMEQL